MTTPTPIRVSGVVLARTDPHGGRRAAFALAVSTLAGALAIWLWPEPLPKPPPLPERPVIALNAMKRPSPPARAPVEPRPPAPAPTAAPPKAPSLPVAPSPVAAPPVVPPPVAPPVSPRPISSPARAGRAVTTRAAPVDFEATLPEGPAAAFPGGHTTSDGTGTDPAAPAPTPAAPEPRPEPAPEPELAPDPGPDRSRPVAVRGTDWNCDWPAEADEQQIDTQSVTVRVDVAADGRPLAARPLRDPGHGFGAAAVECALARRYHPAQDRAGSPIAATSPPIRVRFTR